MQNLTNKENRSVYFVGIFSKHSLNEFSKTPDNESYTAHSFLVLLSFLITE